MGTARNGDTWDHRLPRLTERLLGSRAGVRWNLSTHTGWLSRLGKSDEAVRLHLDAANGGATFLRIFAPNDIDAERVMNVIRRAPFSLAHRYQRFAIQHMT